MNLYNLRKEYKREVLNKSSQRDPFHLFKIWMQEAIESKVYEPTAMMLSTVSSNNKPSSRVVLLKSFTQEGFVLFTNYKSRKGLEIASNMNVALLFFWPELEREVRIEGVARMTPEDVSDHYFQERPYDSRVSALVSPQSQKIESREKLEEEWQKTKDIFEGKHIPRPSGWGGYIVSPNWIEFWQGRPNRLHDRILFELKEGGWEVSRLAP